MKTKFIITTGGVLSGLGKGVACASIGNLLKTQGFSVFALKLDPYLNIDPGVMSPNEHGEVFVTADGGETDLDLGHYERFIDVKLNKDSNYTSGKIFTRIFEKERRGEYGGKTVQIVPHVTDEIIKIVTDLAESKQPDFMLIEIGGTVGDIESNPYIYAMSKFAAQHPANVLFTHLAFVPYLSASKEYKSKPSQVSIATLRSYGINPNLLLLRSQGEIDHNIIRKVAESSFLNPKQVISVPDKSTIYEVPLYLLKQGVLEIIFEHFHIQKEIELTKHQNWSRFIEKYLLPKQHQIKLLLVGKYMGLDDAYLSIIESIKIAQAHNDVKIDFDLVSADTINAQNADEILTKYDGVLILPGFGKRGFESKIFVSNYTRTHNIPTLGICLGFQAMVVNQARLQGISNATSKEFASASATETYVLTPFYENGDKQQIGGTLRLGEDQVIAKPGTLAAKIYGDQVFFQRHRHRYEVAPQFRESLQDENFVFSGSKPASKNVAEICELKNHPFYLGVQYHPEFTTRVLTSNPLFDSFIQAVIVHKTK
ncbi:CTP synthase [Mycoplasmopsis columbinasalis]|uniref:CTP synthase (glutamine hydrolyzing) n=1 Tax=Mycoplasmopsis columbinasalis TaxID=114880 RepID=A0A449B9U8_9BACT|nr:CTP synthase [Mycoplasmopsis columbinasalis]VEU77935.1 CTP synthetase [Mycoplasmopsis columbinasalis]